MASNENKGALWNLQAQKLWDSGAGDISAWSRVFVSHEENEAMSGCLLKTVQREL